MCRGPYCSREQLHSCPPSFYRTSRDHLDRADFHARHPGCFSQARLGIEKDADLASHDAILIIVYDPRIWGIERQHLYFYSRTSGQCIFHVSILRWERERVNSTEHLESFVVLWFK